MDITFDYYAFRETFVTTKVECELNFYKNHEYKDITPMAEYIQYIEKRINIDQQNKKTKSVIYSRTGFQTMDVEEHTKDMDILSYNRPWNKLKEIHKIRKIKEYINSLEYNKKININKINNNKKILTEELCNGLKEKKFTKNKIKVEYDQEKMLITSISCLDNVNGLYVVDWD